MRVYLCARFPRATLAGAFALCASGCLNGDMSWSRAALSAAGKPAALFDPNAYYVWRNPDLHKASPGDLNAARGGLGAAVLGNGKVVITGGFKQPLVAANFLSTSEVYDPAAGSWSITGPAATMRRAAFAVTLADGRALFGGGSDLNNVSTNAVEIYDPATGTFSPAAATNFSGYYFSPAILLPNGKVFVASGIAQAQGEVYDPATNKWTLTVNGMQEPRTAAAAILLPTGKVLVAGGRSTLNSLTSSHTDLYDPMSNTFSPGPVMTVPREAFALVLLPGGASAVAIGGMDDSLVAPSLRGTCEYYNVAGNAFATGNCAAMVTARNAHHASVLKKGANVGKVLVYGGNSGPGTGTSVAELFNPATGLFVASASYHDPKGLDEAAVDLPDGRIMVLGGGNNGETQAIVEVFDPLTMTWGLTTGEPVRFGYPALQALKDGQVFVSGGMSSDPACVSGSCQAAAVWNSLTRRWVSAGNMLYPRNNHTLSLLPNGKIWVAGGYGGAGPGYIAPTEFFDLSSWSFALGPTLPASTAGAVPISLPGGDVLLIGGSAGAALSNIIRFKYAASSAATAAVMAAGRSNHTAHLLPSGKVLIIGGNNGAAAVATTEIFDPGTNTVAAGPALPVALQDHASAMEPDGTVYVFGGTSGASVPAGAIYMYTVASNAWTTLPATLVTPRQRFSALLLPSGQVVLTPGAGTTAAVSSYELFDPTLMTSTVIANSQYPRGAPASAALLPDGRVFVMGADYTYANGYPPEVLRFYAPVPLKLAQGVATPVLFTLLSGNGLLDALSGVYYPYYLPETARIRVQDSSGNQDRCLVTGN